MTKTADLRQIVFMEWALVRVRNSKKIRNNFEIPVTSDFSDPRWATETGEVCDIIQVPNLCRQTSILKAAAETKKPVNLKKGQFMSPWNMKNSVKKLEYHGCNEIILTDRGTFLGIICWLMILGLYLL